MVWTADLLAGTPPLLVAAASLPAALLAGLLLLAQKGGERPRVALAFALAWGATGAAFLASVGNELVRERMAALAGEGTRELTAVLAAPMLEEGAKALGLVLLLAAGPAFLRGVRDGLVYGGLVGLGFVWTENLLYLGVAMLQGGEAGLLRAVYLRGIVGAATHVVFTAGSGAGIGWWASGRRARTVSWPWPLLALAAALAQHTAWNAFAAPAIAAALCGAPSADAACRDSPTMFALYGEGTAIAAAFLAPGLVLAMVAWRASREQDKHPGA